MILLRSKWLRFRLWAATGLSRLLLTGADLIQMKKPCGLLRHIEDEIDFLGSRRQVNRALVLPAVSLGLPSLAL